MGRATRLQTCAAADSPRLATRYAAGAESSSCDSLEELGANWHPDIAARGLLSSAGSGGPGSPEQPTPLSGAGLRARLLAMPTGAGPARGGGPASRGASSVEEEEDEEDDEDSSEGWLGRLAHDRDGGGGGGLPVRPVDTAELRAGLLRARTPGAEQLGRRAAATAAAFSALAGIGCAHQPPPPLPLARACCATRVGGAERPWAGWSHCSGSIFNTKMLTPPGSGVLQGGRGGDRVGGAGGAGGARPRGRSGGVQGPVQGRGGGGQEIPRPGAGPPHLQQTWTVLQHNGPNRHEL